MDENQSKGDLLQKFQGTHPVFQAKINAIAAVAGMTSLEAYALWRKYSNSCTDQSALIWEFVRWHKDELGGNVKALDEAVDAVDEFAV